MVNTLLRRDPSSTTVPSLPSGVVPVAGDDGATFEPQVGYRRFVKDEAERFSHRYDVVCSEAQIVALVHALVDVLLPGRGYAIVEEHYTDPDGATYLSWFHPLETLQESCWPHLERLVEDGMVGFGFAWYDDESLEEVFVDDHNVVMIYTSQPTKVEDVLARHGVELVEGLQTVAEHPHAHTSVSGDGLAFLEDTLFAPLSMKRQ